jgi:peptidase M28-like protein/PDZ domain-containing protein
MKECGLAPGGLQNSYYQKFDAGYANLLGVIEGSDPELKKQHVIVSAHYDHVGYGSRTNSYGPLGRIHNGADDNASGISGLIEVMRAFQALEVRPKRSILFAFWDGEEKGLLGSKHWINRPTVPLKQVPLMINVDMIGRLRRNRMEVWGTRTSAGLRRLVSLQNVDNGPAIDFTWELKDNSDHWSFYSRQIPILMLHTGLHDDYHRPSDDADKVNATGLQSVSRLMFGVVDEAANSDRLQGFRSACKNEMPGMRSMLELPLPELPSRLGVRWEVKEDGGIHVTSVAHGSPAERAGVRLRDSIVSFAGIDVNETKQLQFAVLAAPKETSMVVAREGEEEPLELLLKLNGAPTRLGIGWRFDSAEPGTVILSRVVPGSPAAYAGLRPGDRVYRIARHEFTDGDSFGRLAKDAVSPIDLQIERDGKVRTATLEFPEMESATEPAAEL